MWSSVRLVNWAHVFDLGDYDETGILEIYPSATKHNFYRSSLVLRGVLELGYITVEANRGLR
jgi:hypothetical protein